MNRNFLSIIAFACFFVLISSIQSCDPQDDTNTEHCTNGIKDEDEIAIDCGGTLCDTCLPAPVACFTGPDTALILQTPIFYTCDTGATTYNWSFGDGQTSTMASPGHTYSATGIYTIKQVVSNGQRADSTTKTIEVKELRNYHYAGNYFGHTICPGFSDFTFGSSIITIGTDSIGIDLGSGVFCHAFVSGYNITIPMQTINSFWIHGSGTLSYNRADVTLNYTQGSSGFPDETCTSTFQREW